MLGSLDCFRFKKVNNWKYKFDCLTNDLSLVYTLFTNFGEYSMNV